LLKVINKVFVLVLWGRIKRDSKTKDVYSFFPLYAKTYPQFSHFKPTSETIINVSPPHFGHIILFSPSNP